MNQFCQQTFFLKIPFNSQLKKIVSFFKREIKKFASYKVSKTIKNALNDINKDLHLAPYGKKYRNQIKIKVKLDGIKNDFSDFMKRNPLMFLVRRSCCRLTSSSCP